ncbi:hypothetical protein GOARA_091_00270 [Gordonia araii NBRC 100433]|uniref:PPE domain-containing protein n=1 Tax=Gordonia araii NBRC 100433 TaxID=1073574 RepID=G7H7T4_9ACTN|nr:PPE domain-containing protein [Gordonia araii]NNG95650.1 PPE domain-containing protein [Gordonia araii NBRC 100433]GAB11909.1 hypothetical protein GOARA_091_00270 [Gordonia araii NBRC 100433]
MAGSGSSNAGFTGVVWESRPTEKLATDLVSGAGPAPLAEAGLAWANLAEEVAAIGVEYAKVLANLGVHWESLTFNHAFEKLMQLAPWFADTAAKLTDTAVKAETQAAANTVALATMPSLPEVAITEEMAALLAQAGVMLGAPMVASGTANDKVKHEMAQRAARVMQSYEQATQPVAAAWSIGKPPQIVSADALNAERAAAAAKRTKATEATKVGSLGSAAAMGGMGGIGAMPREKSKYAATSLASVEAAPVLAPPISTDTNRSGMVPMAPMGAAGAAAAAGNRSDTVARSTATPSKAAATDDNSSVRLPAGWLSSDDNDGPTSWTQVAERMDEADRAPIPGEGVLNLGPASPPVLGAPEGGDR